MKYVLECTEEELLKNSKVFDERLSVYKEKGLDFVKNREFLLEKAGLIKGKVLDIGSGRGLSSLFLAEAGHMVTSIDIEESMLRISALNVASKGLIEQVEFHKMDVYSMEFDPESFGAIFVVEALHHIEDVGELLGEVDKVLLPGGVIVLADFNEQGMGIVDRMHASEGNEHTVLNTGSNKAEEWFAVNEYEVKSYDDKCYWVIVAQKNIK